MSLPFDPDWMVHPGATLGEWIECMEAQGSTHVRERVASYVGGESVLGGLLAGTEPLTPYLALRLEEATCVAASFWVEYESRFRHGVAAGKHWSGAEA